MLITLAQDNTAKAFEYIMAFRVFVVILGVLATLLSLQSSSIYGLWVLVPKIYNFFFIDVAH